MAIYSQPVVRSTLFGYRVGFSGTADLMALFSIRTNSRWRPPPSWIMSNGHQLQLQLQRLTIYLYSAHRAVIFAIAQLSCSTMLLNPHGALSESSVVVWFNANFLTFCVNTYNSDPCPRAPGLITILLAYQLVGYHSTK